MSIRNNARHLAYLKRQAKALRGSNAASLAFFIVVHTETEEVLMHLDAAATADVYRNPAAIHRRLKRLKALKPEGYAPFFADTRQLVSVAGDVHLGEDGRSLVFVRTVRTGKGTKKHLTRALKTFRMLRGKVGTAKEVPEEAPPTVDEVRVQLATWFGERTPTPEHAVDAVYGQMGSVDALAGVIDALEIAVSDGSATAQERDTLRVLEEAYALLDIWSEDVGILGVQDGFAELVQQADLGEAWELLFDEMRDRAVARWARGVTKAETATSPRVVATLLRGTGVWPVDVFAGRAETLRQQPALRHTVTKDVVAALARCDEADGETAVAAAQLAPALRRVVDLFARLESKLD